MSQWKLEEHQQVTLATWSDHLWCRGPRVNELFQIKPRTHESDVDAGVFSINVRVAKLISHPKCMAQRLASNRNPPCPAFEVLNVEWKCHVSVPCLGHRGSVQCHGCGPHLRIPMYSVKQAAVLPGRSDRLCLSLSPTGEGRLVGVCRSPGQRC